jgi:hypothetical protein
MAKSNKQRKRKVTETLDDDVNENDDIINSKRKKISSRNTKQYHTLQEISEMKENHFITYYLAKILCNLESQGYVINETVRELVVENLVECKKYGKFLALNLTKEWLHGAFVHPWIYYEIKGAKFLMIYPPASCFIINDSCNGKRSRTNDDMEKAGIREYSITDVVFVAPLKNKDHYNDEIEKIAYFAEAHLFMNFMVCSQSRLQKLKERNERSNSLVYRGGSTARIVYGQVLNHPCDFCEIGTKIVDGQITIVLTGPHMSKHLMDHGRSISEFQYVIIVENASNLFPCFSLSITYIWKF